MAEIVAKSGFLASPDQIEVSETCMHKSINPPILYLGTPVVLVSTLNDDGTPNISPMSSAWWLGWSCMLGLDASSQTTINLRRTGECVLNLPTEAQVANVDALSRKTAADPMPFHKAAMGWDIQKDKFGISGLTPQTSTTVSPPRIAECPIQLEATLVNDHAFAEDDPKMLIPTRALEVRITKVHADEEVLSAAFEDRFEPDKWHPLIMSFLKFYARGASLHPLGLSKLPPEAWAGRAPKPKS
jgi:flavin reductase (DIM6/NTAB) family NADH-FMN oxidoreductase RutF